ncbi:hypothetical protein [Streptomyces sp. XC 2026]|uniref:hypothetical protein n=1 Tax=Streptomyces sp. XC 2026 TaxID=2782004 RepID=UPI0019065EF7|nr:hypothetical protein [Streptomyces sp. XC 2026]QQN79777.1 hypothetical protein IPZ77_21875 [Streptomyces sp. XC 2026]QQN80615.1 hypothetical protein IPZ77_26780 [Streptomyces sp. XC 2026]
MPIIPDQPSELILTESRTMRAQTIERTDVLDKVKALALLPDGAHATTEIVAGYYEVDAEVIKKTVQRHREELTENGLRVLRGEELSAFVGDNLSLSPNARKIRNLSLFSRRAILNVGQLLTESDIARQVRTYLLEVEEQAAPEVRSGAADLVALAESRMRVLKAAAGIVDAAWLETKARLVAARALGEEPEVDPLDAPLYVPDFLKGKGLNRRDIESVQSWFGRRAASLYEAEHGEKPGKRQSDLPNGSVRETYAWTQRHMPFFEETWDRYYAAQFPTQLDLGGAA